VKLQGKIAVVTGGARCIGRAIAARYASRAGRRGEALVSLYCGTKAAVISLTQSAGLDLIKHGINGTALLQASSIRRCGPRSTPFLLVTSAAGGG
jgi:NAD(P)-dependent dehydrogenase (short-subunit alcohol dehydrogenase family)